MICLSFFHNGFLPDKALAKVDNYDSVSYLSPNSL